MTNRELQGLPGAPWLPYIPLSLKVGQCLGFFGGFRSYFGRSGRYGYHVLKVVEKPAKVD